jgi:biotin transport system substrate-specific component
MTSTTSVATSVSSRVYAHLRRAAAVTAGALAVALASQFAVPLPGTPVPMTLQPLAVLIVGGLLGPGYGALSLMVYLEMGVAGLPVFTPVGAPGFARLLGPTGGYLLAYPVAAALTGWLARRAHGRLEMVIAPLAGLVVIHVGGLAQLALLSGSIATAAATGSLPFLAGDLLKVGIAAAVLYRLLPRRARSAERGPSAASS